MNEKPRTAGVQWPALDLDKLEAVAANMILDAWQFAPIEPTLSEGYVVKAPGSSTRSYQLLDVAETTSYEVAEFIATFDPPTVMALISRLRIAESGQPAAG